MPPSGTGIGVDKQRVVRNVLTDYHGLLVNNPLYPQEQSIVERSNRKQLMTRGEVSQERREHAEKLGNVLSYSQTCFLFTFYSSLIIYQFSQL